MFSGIIESTSTVFQSNAGEGSLIRIRIQRPFEFTDIKIGDSIAVNGICLTVETFSDEMIQFALADETLKILQMNPREAQTIVGRKLNLERSLKFGDRIHGHLVSGHVDSLGTVTRADAQGEIFYLDVDVAPEVKFYLWKKGSIALNGVSLTVNKIENLASSDGARISVCLIPETLQRTNLGELQCGQKICVEADYFAKGLHQYFQAQNEFRSMSQKAVLNETQSKPQSAVQSQDSTEDRTDPIFQTVPGGSLKKEAKNYEK